MLFRGKVGVEVAHLDDLRRPFKEGPGNRALALRRLQAQGNQVGEEFSLRRAALLDDQATTFGNQVGVDHIHFLVGATV